MRGLLNKSLRKLELAVFESRYELGDTLGVGSTSVVQVAVDRATGRGWACKVVTDPDDRAAAKTEIRLAKQLCHPHIAKYREHFDTEAGLYIITELLRGPNLLDELLMRGSFSEEDASLITAQLLSALEYMHGKGIVHRDVKLENIMLSTDDGLIDVKLVDFGLAGQVTPVQPALSQPCGTPMYVAPEVLARKPAYGPAVDVWSAGVVLFALLSGEHPFTGSTPFKLVQAVFSGSTQGGELFASPVWQLCSDGSRRLVERMLTREPSNRPTPALLLEDPFLRANL